MIPIQTGDKVKVVSNQRGLKSWVNPTYRGFNLGKDYTYHVMWTPRQVSPETWIEMRRYTKTGALYNHTYYALYKDLLSVREIEMLKVPLEDFL